MLEIQLLTPPPLQSGERRARAEGGERERKAESGGILFFAALIPIIIIGTRRMKGGKKSDGKRSTKSPFLIIPEIHTYSWNAPGGCYHPTTAAYTPKNERRCPS